MRGAIRRVKSLTANKTDAKGAAADWQPMHKLLFRSVRERPTCQQPSGFNTCKIMHRNWSRHKGRGMVFILPAVGRNSCESVSEMNPRNYGLRGQPDGGVFPTLMNPD